MMIGQYSKLKSMKIPIIRFKITSPSFMYCFYARNNRVHFSPRNQAGKIVIFNSHVKLKIPLLPCSTHQIFYKHATSIVDLNEV